MGLRKAMPVPIAQLRVSVPVFPNTERFRRATLVRFEIGRTWGVRKQSAPWWKSIVSTPNLPRQRAHESGVAALRPV
jgi:hypothetical protein